ncbi:hypothetical protein M4R22_18320 [Acidovorax sp. GBBC 3334]|uniref:hypothetical protein n=1 Tax=Acidovorax sp. GBBC 3334 TaxID=2940496 RepID=UPI002302802E|nr:hypothetical protein [Acidovorax sp. GBBC 3334]MDA8456720.1 hypothetical protein [Acidovorax sp. GBBC 3334]
MSDLRAPMRPWPGRLLRAMQAVLRPTRGLAPEPAEAALPPVRPEPRTPHFLVHHTHWPACARAVHARN